MCEGVVIALLRKYTLQSRLPFNLFTLSYPFLRKHDIRSMGHRVNVGQDQEVDSGKKET